MFWFVDGAETKCPFLFRIVASSGSLINCLSRTGGNCCYVPAAGGVLFLRSVMREK